MKTDGRARAPKPKAMAVVAPAAARMADTGTAAAVLPPMVPAAGCCFCMCLLPRVVASQSARHMETGVGASVEKTSRAAWNARRPPRPVCPASITA